MESFLEQLEKDVNSPEFALADKMLKLMSDGKMRYIGDVADILDVGYFKALEVFRVLQKQGKLHIDNEVLNEA